MLRPDTDFERLRRSFRWEIPARFNIAVAACDRHADAAAAGAEGNPLALIQELPSGEVRRYGFVDLRRLSNRLANVLAAAGVVRGDRVGILLGGQGLDPLLAHLAIYKLGAVAVPLFSLFGPDALLFRLRDSGACALITDAAGLAKVEPLCPELPELRRIWSTEGVGSSGAADLQGELARAADRFEVADTGPDDPALLIYTSGTTGPPKGALHGHRVLLGHLPGVQIPQEFFPQPGDLFWTPADWAWIGGLMDVLMPSLYFGVPVLAEPPGRFDPEAAAWLMARHGVRNAFLPPTALRLIRQTERGPLAAGARLRSIGSGGEKLGDEVIAWGRDAFGVEINEFYGQTEANLVISGIASVLPRRPGAIGKAVPGHEVAIVDDQDGRPLPPGEVGQIAVRRPDPVVFLGYWQNPEATAAKFRGDWLLTGDLGRMDGDGYVTYVARDDDLITSAGYRIGPGEVEDCLAKHPAVALCAVIGVPDPVRGEAVKAFVVPAPGHRPGPELAAEIQGFVRARLAAHEYPRAVEFLDALPLTATGKVRRRDLREREATRADPKAPPSGQAVSRDS